MPKPNSDLKSSRPGQPPDDDDTDLSNSTSTNAALLPGAPMGGEKARNNGFLWTNKPSQENTSNSSAFPILLNEEDNEPSANTSDVVMTELGNSPHVEMRVGPSNSTSRHQTGSSSRKGTKPGSNSICYYLRQYRCQLIFLLIAFIEFGILIAGITFYFAGVLTANCDHNNSSRQGKKTISGRCAISM